MTTATWITMIVIMAFVWGGLAVAVRTAIRKESAKAAATPAAATPAPATPSSPPDP